MGICKLALFDNFCFYAIRDRNEDMASRGFSAIARLITFPPTHSVGPVLFCSLSSVVVVCRRL